MSTGRNSPLSQCIVSLGERILAADLVLSVEDRGGAQGTSRAGADRDADGTVERSRIAGRLRDAWPDSLDSETTVEGVELDDERRPKLSHLSAPLFDDRGGRLGVLCAMAEGARTWSAEDRRHLAELAQLLARLDAPGAGADSQLHRIVHDLRTPLTTALLNVQIALLGNGPSHEELKLAEGELRRMSRMLEGFAGEVGE